MKAVPEMTDPLGAYWDQPKLSEIEIDDNHALMSIQSLSKLYEYSNSMPSGVYVGKMWKCKTKDCWLLRWYGDCKDPGYVSNH